MTACILVFIYDVNIPVEDGFNSTGGNALSTSATPSPLINVFRRITLPVSELRVTLYMPDVTLVLFISVYVPPDKSIVFHVVSSSFIFGTTVSEVS